MTVVLDRGERDVLYRLLVTDLPDAGDISRELHDGHLRAAGRLRQIFDEDVLLLDLLDWDEQGDRDSYPITLPAEQTEQIFQRLYTRIMSDVEEAMSVLLQQHPLVDALEAARICTHVLRTARLMAEDTAGRRASLACDVPRRPHCA